jgi:hypothetical protein
VFLVDTDTVNELGPRAVESVCRERIARVAVNGKDLPETAAPDSRKESERKQQVVLPCVPIHEHCNSWRADAEVY